MPEATQNILEALMEELNRNKELLTEYEAIGPAGQFGAMMLRQSIKRAEQAITESDTVAMIRCYEDLKTNE